MTDKPTTEQMALIREHLRDHHLLANWMDDIILSRLADYDTLKAEAERLEAKNDEYATTASHALHDLLCEEEARKKAEAELAEARPLLEAVMAWDGRLGKESHAELIKALDAYRAKKEEEA